MPSKIESDFKSDAKGQKVRRNILCFHKLTDRFTYGSTNYSPRRLARLIEFLTKSGFKFVSLNELLTDSDSNKIAITFDDGYAHLIQTLPPLMEKYGLNPTIFMPTAYVGKTNSWDYSSLILSEPHLNKFEIAELAVLGVEFGSHGHHHFDLTRCSSELLNEELKQSKSILEAIIHKPIDCLSYPFGRFNAQVIEAAEKAGYKQAFTMHFSNESDSACTLGRVPVYFFDSPAFVEQKLSGGQLQRVHQKLNHTINLLSQGTTLFNRFRWSFRES